MENGYYTELFKDALHNRKKMHPESRYFFEGLTKDELIQHIEVLQTLIDKATNQFEDFMQAHEETLIECAKYNEGIKKAFAEHLNEIIYNPNLSQN
jgi:hypothetical protein